MVKTLKILTALICMLQDCNLNLKVRHLMYLLFLKKESGGIVDAVQSQIQKFGSASAESTEQEKWVKISIILYNSHNFSH